MQQPSNQHNIELLGETRLLDGFARWWGLQHNGPIVVVGRGRWARVWQTVVSTSQAPRARAVGETVTIVANAARDHISAARAAAESGSHALIEKPMGLDAPEVSDILSEFEAAGRLCLPGHVMMFAPYLHEFRLRFLPGMGHVHSYELEWCDGVQDVRFGALKETNYGVPLILDLWPHVDSVLRIALGSAPLCRAARVRRGGLEVEIEAQCEVSRGRIFLAKDFAERRRVLRLTTDTGLCELDFSTSEPASFDGPGGKTVLDSYWSLFPSPLRLQLGCLLDAAAGNGAAVSAFCTMARESAIEMDKAFACTMSALAPSIAVSIDGNALGETSRLELLQCLPRSFSHAAEREPFGDLAAEEFAIVTTRLRSILAGTQTPSSRFEARLAEQIRLIRTG